MGKLRKFSNDEGLPIKSDGKIPERFFEQILIEVHNASSGNRSEKWKKLDGLRGNFYSLELNKRYRILRTSEEEFWCMHHDTYSAKIKELKKHGF